MKPFVYMKERGKYYCADCAQKNELSELQPVPIDELMGLEDCLECGKRLSLMKEDKKEEVKAYVIGMLIKIANKLEQKNLMQDASILDDVIKRVAEDTPKDCRDNLKDKKKFTEEEAKKIGEKIGIDWSLKEGDDGFIDLNEFRMGLTVEMEHGKLCDLTNVTDDDLNDTGKIARIHLIELPDYYSRLKKMESEGEKTEK